MRRLGWCLIALVLLTAGCLGLGSEEGDGEEPVTDASADPGAGDEETETDEGSEEETDADSDEETTRRTLEEPPELEDGEWWTVEIRSPFTGLETEATIVKAGGHGDRYMVGMPDESFVEDAVLLHLPPHGPVEAATLGYPVHDSVFQPLSFPLEEGQSWETSWIDEPLEAEVVEAEDGAATIEMDGESSHVEVRYEAELGYPRSITIDGYGEYEVVDHGTGYDGELHVPWDPELAFFSGRIAGAFDTTLNPAPPMEEIEVTGEHNEAVVALLLGNVVGGPPGVYEASVQAPDGSTHEGRVVATPDSQGLVVDAVVIEDPTGTWEMEYVAGGAGIAAVEGIAYNAMHVVMEDGELRGMM